MVNFFYLDHDPHLCAQYYCNKHVVKIPIEIAQILSKIQYELKESKQLDLYYKMPKMISSTIPPYRWIKQSKANYLYAVRLALALITEYKFRYDKENHKTEDVLRNLERDIPNSIPDIGQTPFLMTNRYDFFQYLSDDILLNNLYFYVDVKCKGDKWGKRGKPIWFSEIEEKLGVYKTEYREKIISQLIHLSKFYSKKIGIFVRICYDTLLRGAWQRKAKLINKYKSKYRLFDQLTFPHLYCMYEISKKLENPKILKELYVISLNYRKNLSKLGFPSSKINYRHKPEYYVYLFNTLGYDVIRPYVSEITSNSIDDLYCQFLDYLDSGDFIGADMTRKKVQVLDKSSDKLDLIKNNADYMKWKLSQNYMLTDPYVPSKKIFS